MTSHYRDMMVEVLRDFDNNQHSDEFYNAISWIGLKNTEGGGELVCVKCMTIQLMEQS